MRRQRKRIRSGKRQREPLVWAAVQYGETPPTEVKASPFIFRKANLFERFPERVTSNTSEHAHLLPVGMGTHRWGTSICPYHAVDLETQSKTQQQQQQQHQANIRASVDDVKEKIEAKRHGTGEGMGLEGEGEMLNELAKRGK